MSEEFRVDSDENSDYMYNGLDRMIEEVGPRAPGSGGEKKGSEWVKKELDKFCDKTKMEEFSV